MTNKQIEQKALELFPVRKKLNKKCTGEYDPNLPRRKAYIQGAMEALQGVWKDGQGDDLPEMDKEVVTLIQYGDGFRVVFAHRVEEGAEVHVRIDGELLVMHPVGYDKARWNQPDVMWWLDVELPKP